MIKNYIWDFDGMLFDSYPHITAAFEKMMADYGESIDKAETQKMFEINFATVFNHFGTTDLQKAQFKEYEHDYLLEPIAVSYELPGASMRGLGYSMTPTIITVLGTCAFRLLWIYTVCPIYPSYEALMVVYPISWVITGVATIIAYRIVSKKAYRMLPAPAEAAPPCKCLA